ncbi:hypothetical protein FNV43_RR14435 [Rhamnella rubrinervis]|uniref:LOB domain-containing protein n=1 Tax=Rhamnella rubrinervis TaxID=2594499 RepID=A0A8K0MGB6_9ROSA|nr:hypothetical protein FNV43_RR14435 [Rhamnella rubrinervis]
MKKDSQSSSSLPSPPPPPPPPSSINIPNHCLILLLVLFIPGCTFFLIMTIKGGTSQACAACKYQRRRCSKECALAPYFPAEKAKEFQNAHRLFGVRNIMNILKQVPPQQKEDAMTSIIFESDMRAQYPIRGCMGIISQLHIQIQQVIDELRMVQSKIAICKEQFQYNSSSSNNNNQIMPLTPPNNNNHSSSSLPQLHLGIATSKNDHDGVLIYPQYNYGSSEMPIEFLGNGMPTASMNGIYVEGTIIWVQVSSEQARNSQGCQWHNQALKKIPKWWVRLYPFCPTSWSLKALLTSQFGDVEKEIVIFGERKAIDALFKSYYGYDYDDLGVAAFVLLAYVLVFAFGFHMLLVNFQKR